MECLVYTINDMVRCKLVRSIYNLPLGRILNLTWRIEEAIIRMKMWKLKVIWLTIVPMVDENFFSPYKTMIFTLSWRNSFLQLHYPPIMFLYNSYSYILCLWEKYEWKKRSRIYIYIMHMLEARRSWIWWERIISCSQTCQVSSPVA